MFKALATFAVASAMDCENTGHPAVSNGTLDCSTVLAPGSAACTLTCVDNYRVKTPPTRMCSAAGAWTGESGECEITCGTNGDYCKTASNLIGKCNLSSNTCVTSGLCVGKTTDAACGHETDSALRGECYAPGGNCKLPVANCSNPVNPAVLNGTLSCLATPGSPGCTLTCPFPYRIKTPTGRKCSAEGAWTGVDGDCERVPNCSNTGHPAVANGTLNCSAVLAPGSAKCTLTCANNNTIKTATGRMCSSAGVWMGANGECESTTTSTTRDNDHSAAISTVTAIAIAAFALH